MTAFYTYGELEAAHLTGRTRVRAGWRGRLILQVEIKHPRASYPAPPRPWVKTIRGARDRSCSGVTRR